MARSSVSLSLLVGALGCGSPQIPAAEPAPDAGVPPDAAPVDAGASDSGPADGGEPTCLGETGLFRDQTLEVDGRERRYLLYVPEAARCTSAWPVLFDFHGAYGGPDPAEEVYTLDGAIQAADRFGFVLVRPRSTTIPVGDQTWYYWDGTAADVTANLAFTRALLEDVERRYTVDPERIYALGFSNGTQMALRLLAEPASPFRGSAVIAGGYWTPFPLPALPDGPRIYVATGYRDLHHQLGVPQLEAALARAGYPLDRLFERASMAGHALFPWHYDDAFRWLDGGPRPADGSLPNDWTEAPILGESLLAATSTIVTSPSFAAVGTGGAAWSFAGASPSQLPLVPASSTGERNLTGICTTPTGARIAAAGAELARLDPAGTSWTLARLPQSPDAYVPLVLDVSCLPSGRVVAGGVSGYASDDDGLTWQPLFLGYPGYGAAQIDRLHRTAAGTLIAAGEYYLGVSTDAEHFTLVDGWNTYYAVTSHGQDVWAAGPSGVLARSTDDGVSWSVLSTGSTADVYDLATRDGERLVAVGARGAVLVSEDAGATWRTIESHLDRMLTVVRIDEQDRVWIFGEGGFEASF